MQTKILGHNEGREEKRIGILFVVCSLLLSCFISFCLTGCGGGGGSSSSSDGPIGPALFSGWEMTKGPFSGMAYSLAVDPNNSQKLYAAVGIGGLFSTDDGGLDWIQAEGGLKSLSILAVAVAGDGQTIYAGTDGDGIYRTTNGGGSWGPVSKGLPIDPQSQKYFDVDDLLIDPQDKRIVYAKLAWLNYLYRTTDGGNSWKRIGLDLPFEPIMSLAIHPVSTEVLYAGTDSNGVWKSVDRGDSWDEINGNLPSHIVHFPCLAVDADNNILYAGSRDYGLWKTLDDGVTWDFMKVGDLTGWWNVYVLAMDPADKSLIYAYIEDVRLYDPKIFNPEEDGIYRTNDGGNNWEQVPFHEYFNTYRHVREIVIAPSDGNVVYVTTQGEGLFMTNDITNVDDVGDWVPIDNGLVNLPIYAMILNPWDNKVVYVGTEEGIYKTADGGLTWEKKEEKDVFEDKHVFALASDPMDANVIYAATENGVYKTTNGGDSWSGPGGYWFYSLAIGTLNPGVNIIYGGSSFGEGIYKTVDDGVTPWAQITWEVKNNGLSDDEKYANCLAIVPSNPLVLYAGTGYRRWPGPETAGKVIKTPDGGDTWERKVDGLPPDQPICSLSLYPLNPQILYAGTHFGFYASSDGGETWAFKDGGLGQRLVKAIAIDPMDSKKVCVGTYEDGVFASIDGGENWTQIDRGLTCDLNKRILSLAMDLRNPDDPVVYAGTGCGVFKAYK